MKYICFFSGGISSFKVAKYLFDNFDKEDIILLFTDTRNEDEDLYRFLNDAEKKFNHKITKIQDGRNVWELFLDVGFVGNSRVGVCSTSLKKNVAKKWIKEYYKPDECILYFGIEQTEQRREYGIRKNWLPYKVEFPLNDDDIYSKYGNPNILDKCNIKKPRLYDLGFAHNNCRGACVKAGSKQWALLLEKSPDVYRYNEENEEKFFSKYGKSGHKGIIKQTTKGKIKYLSLKQFRETIESQLKIDFDSSDFQIGCDCMSESD